MMLADLPASDDFDALFDFAMTFDGYRHFGSFEACAAAAASQNRSTLEEVRNELFFAARATRHTDYDTLTPTYIELRPLLRSFIEAGS